MISKILIGGNIKRVLVACESSCIVREAFKKRGWEAWSCDLLDGEVPGNHIKDDVIKYLNKGWDLMIAFPPCIYLCSSGIHWNSRRPERAKLTQLAIAFFMALVNAPIDKICIENPVGIMSSIYKPPTQYIHPYEVGHDASKKTGLWLKNLPPLIPPKSLFVQPRIVKIKDKTFKRWANQTDSGQNRLGPSPDRWKERSRTYQGLADLMADTWSHL